MLLILCALGTPEAAAAHGWRLVARGVESLVTDGVRYAVWQRPGSPATLVDTFSGHEQQLPSGCSALQGADGRLLLDCEEHQQLLDIRSGSVTPLPALEPGSKYAGWDSLGRYFVGGAAAPGTHCDERPAHDECVALYDIATGVTTFVPKLKLSNLDRPDAPPVCRAARQRLLALAHFERLEAFQYLRAYENGLLATPEQMGERPLSRIRIDRCQGRPTVIHTHPTPSGIELRGGMLVWTAFIEPTESESNVEQLEATRAEVEAYDVASRRRFAWEAPRVRIRRTTCGERSPVGTEGEADHTRRTVFWMAVVEERCGEHGGSYVSANDLYARPLR